MHPPRWRRHQRSHWECRGSDNAVAVPSCRSWSWRTHRRQLTTLTFDRPKHRVHLNSPIQTKFGELDCVARNHSTGPPWRAVSSRRTVSGTLACRGTFSWSPALAVSVPTKTGIHRCVCTAAFYDTLVHGFPPPHLRSSLLLRMSSGPRSLRLGKRGGGSMRRTGWGWDIILTGGWSRPPANTSKKGRFLPLTR